jgi:hypothetical protein
MHHCISGATISPGSRVGGFLILAVPLHKWPPPTGHYDRSSRRAMKEAASRISRAQRADRPIRRGLAMLVGIGKPGLDSLSCLDLESFADLC